MLPITRAGLKCFIIRNSIAFPWRPCVHSQRQMTSGFSLEVTSHRSDAVRSTIPGPESVGIIDINMREFYNSEPTSLHRWLETAIIGLPADDARKLILKFLKEMEGKNISFSEKFYPLIFKALCIRGYLEEAFKLLNSLVENIYPFPILPLCNFFLGTCVKMKSLPHAHLCLEFMDRFLVGKNEITYWKLLEQYIKMYDTNVLSLRRYLWSLASLDELQAANGVLQNMVALALQDMNSETSVWRMSYPSKLDIPIPSTSVLYLAVDDINRPEVKNGQFLNFNILSTPDIKFKDSVGGKAQMEDLFILKLLTSSFDDVIHACSRCRNLGLAEELFAQMGDLGLEATPRTFDGLISVVVYEKGFGAGLELLKVMHRMNLRPCDSSLRNVAIGCCEALELDTADKLMEEISEAEAVQVCSAYLSACERLDQPERSFPLLRKYRTEAHIRATYERLFSLFGNVNAPYECGNTWSHAELLRRVRAMEMAMMRNKVDHSLISLNYLLRGLGGEGMIQEMMCYFNAATEPHPMLYNTVLHSLVEAHQSDSAVRVFNKMRWNGVAADAATYNIMMHDCCSSDGALSLLSLMMRSGFPPLIHTYTVLIEIHLRSGDSDGYSALMNRLACDGVPLDVVLFNTIIREASSRRRIDLIEAAVAAMLRGNVRPDSSTCEAVFCTYVAFGHMSTAIEALAVLTKVMMVGVEEHDDEFLLSEEDDAEAKILERCFLLHEEMPFVLLTLRCLAVLGCYPIHSFSSPHTSPWLSRILTLRPPTSF